MTIRAYKQEIRPNAKQRAELDQFFGAGRWAFNFGTEKSSLRLANGTRHRRRVAAAGISSMK